MTNSYDECNRCSIKCSKYFKGNLPDRDSFAGSGIDIDKIEKAFDDENLSDREITNVLGEDLKSSRRSPIKNPKNACYEKLAIFCCGNQDHSGYIFYNTDRINDYIDGLTNSIIISTVGHIGKINHNFIDWLKYKQYANYVLSNLRSVLKHVITNSVIFHERFHWARGCGVGEFCEEEAMATAFGIKRTIDLAKGKELNDWEKQLPVSDSLLTLPVNQLMPILALNNFYIHYFL